MKRATPRLITIACLLVCSMAQLALGRDDILTAIPDDAVGFLVIHNVSETNRSVAQLAKIFHITAPDVIGLGKGLSGVAKGIDEEGDFAIYLASSPPKPNLIVLVPVADFAEFFAGLNVKDPDKGVVEAQIVGTPRLVGRKGTYAAIANASDREVLEKCLAATANLSADTALATWLNANRGSVVVTSRGVKEAIPKLMDGISVIQAQIRRAGGKQMQGPADAMNMYADLLTAAQSEVDQLALGIRIDSAPTIDIASRVHFTPGGKWAKWADNAKPATEDLVSGLEAKRFIMAGGGVLPRGMMKEVMKISTDVMRNNPGFSLTPEQSQKYSEIVGRMMSGTKSMRMLMGVSEPGTGLYGDTSTLMAVDDSKAFFESYEKSSAEVHALAAEINNPMFPVPSVQRIKIDDIEALEVSMEMPKIDQPKVPGAPDPEQFKKLIFGTDGKLTYYLAPADEHTIAMGYMSPDVLKRAIQFFKSQKPGLSAEPGVKKVAAKFPEGSQLVAFMSVGGMSKMGKAMLGGVPGARIAAIPDFPDCPPVGYAVKVSAGCVEGHMITTDETLHTIGDTVAKSRGQQLQQQQ